MTNEQTSDVVLDGISILKNQGPVAAAKAALRLFNLNYQGYYFYARYLYHNHLVPERKTTEPFTVIRVDPSQIIHIAEGSIDRWKHFGLVLDGDWDQSDQRINQYLKYRSVVDHFENATPWEETEIYQEAMARIERGQEFWNGCLTKRDLERRAEQIDRLYDRIKEDGYKSQEEIHGKSYRDIVLSRKFDRSMEEVAVAIGRDGELLFIDGNHRLAISHVLGLDSITVHVVARHKKWEEKRNSIRMDTDGPRKNKIEDWIDHPDIRTRNQTDPEN